MEVKLQDLEKLISTATHFNVDQIYPVGSIYMSVNSTSPSVLFGGSWEQIKDTFLLGSGSYTLNSSGGTTAHTHKYGLTAGGYYRETILAEDTEAGLLNYSDNSNYTLKSLSSGGVGKTVNINSSSTASSTSATPNHYTAIANVSYTSNMPPYLVVNI